MYEKSGLPPPVSSALLCFVIVCSCLLQRPCGAYRVRTCATRFKAVCATITPMRYVDVATPASRLAFACGLVCRFLPVFGRCGRNLRRCLVRCHGGLFCPVFDAYKSAAIKALAANTNRMCANLHAVTPFVSSQRPGCTLAASVGHRCQCAAVYPQAFLATS